MTGPFAVPLWLMIGYGVAVPIVVVVYWWKYGPKNFLWFSDIALFCVAGTVFTGDPLLVSMAAVGVLPLEIAWTLDFITGGRLIGLATYMFDAKLPLYLRALSLFHLALPPTMLYLLHGLGYDRRAFIAQTLVIWVTLPLTYAVKPGENINWVYGPYGERQTAWPPLIYLAVEMAVLPLCVVLPMHLLLARLF